MKTDQESLVIMLDDIEKREGKLTEWEAGFVDSISNRIGGGKGLSEKQDECFTKIWERVTEL